MIWDGCSGFGPDGHGEHTRVRARRVLVAAQPGHPGVELRQVPLQRLDLADAAAELALLHGLVEEVEAVPAHHLLHVLRAREDHLYLDVVAVAHAVDQVVGLLGEPPRVEHEDPGAGIDALHHVQHDHAFGRPEGAGQRDPGGEILECPGKDFLGAQGLGLSGANEAQGLMIQGLYPAPAFRADLCGS